jgi:hypothetical protein
MSNCLTNNNSHNMITNISNNKTSRISSTSNNLIKTNNKR